jgi:allophanate hydrolase subunit 1
VKLSLQENNLKKCTELVSKRREVAINFQRWSPNVVKQSLEKVWNKKRSIENQSWKH